MTKILTREKATALLLDGTRGIMGTRTCMLNPVNVLACQKSLATLTTEEISLLRPLAKGMSVARWKKLLGEQRWKEVRSGGAWLMPRSRIETLVEAGAELDLAFCNICHYADLDVIRYMLSKGAFVDAQNKIGSTGLHYNTRNKKYAVIDVLMEHKANVNHPSKDNETPMQAATRMQNWRLMELYWKAGVNLQNWPTPFPGVLVANLEFPKKVDKEKWRLKLQDWFTRFAQQGGQTMDQVASMALGYTHSVKMSQAEKRNKVKEYLLYLIMERPTTSRQKSKV